MARGRPKKVVVEEAPKKKRGRPPKSANETVREVSTKGEYGASDIKLYKGTAAIRKRPGMYLGVGEAAIFQCFYEIFANSLDEAIGGYASRIGIELDDNGIMTIGDNGRGIPWKDITSEGKKIPACVAAAIETHAGEIKRPLRW